MHYNSKAELRSVFESAGSDVQSMFKLIRAEIERHCRPEVVLLRKGDVVVWHPGLMHGGTSATEAGRTQHSAVFHFAPLSVSVRDHRVFPQDFFNLPTYGVVQEGNGSNCRASLPAAMI